MADDEREWTGVERDTFYNAIEPDGSYGCCWKRLDPADPATARCVLLPGHDGPCGPDILPSSDR